MVNILPIRTGDELAHVNQRDVPPGVTLRQVANGTFEVVNPSANPEAAKRFIEQCRLQVADAVHVVA